MRGGLFGPAATFGVPSEGNVTGCVGCAEGDEFVGGGEDRESLRLSDGCDFDGRCGRTTMVGNSDECDETPSAAVTTGAAGTDCVCADTGCCNAGTNANTQADPSLCKPLDTPHPIRRQVYVTFCTQHLNDITAAGPERGLCGARIVPLSGTLWTAWHDVNARAMWLFVPMDHGGGAHLFTRRGQEKSLSRDADIVASADQCSGRRAAVARGCRAGAGRASGKNLRRLEDAAGGVEKVKVRRTVATLSLVSQ